jgi:SNF2 family DNA or RNA helicase
MSYDIILTTYDTLVFEVSEKTKGIKKAPQLLRAVEWHRVVLDEGKQNILEVH